jgi:uncharacterized protein involved in exopolysaccharide biosynthesis
MAALAFAGVNLLTPRYQSEARVLVEGRENIFLRPEADKSMVDRSVVDQETVTSQVQLVLSRDLARDVIKRLNLAELPEFNAALRPPPSPLRFLRSIGLVRDPLSMAEEERVLAAYYERVSAYQVDKSRVIAIEFQSTDPELAARVANAIAETYLTLQQVAKQDQARSAGQWLSGELDKLRIKVSEAEEKVEQFRAKSNLFVGANNTSLSNQQLTEVNSQLSAAQAQKADAETRARLIRQQLSSGQPIESSDITNSELIRRLSEQRVTLRAQLAEQSSTLLPQHPRIKELRAQIADLDRQIRMEGEGLARSLENDAKVAGARVETLMADLDRLKRRAASTSDQDVQLRALEREAKAQRDLFESYLAKYREASARDSIAAAPADARIISRAVVSNVPYFPKKGPIIVIAALAMFCLSTAFVATNALLGSDAFRTTALQFDAAPLSVGRAGDGWPALPAPANPAATSVPPASAADAGARIDAIAATIRNAGEGGRRVAVMGSGHEVGTTLTAIALARSLARDGRVVLVDLAFSAPNIDVISSDPAAPGIADLVRGAASFGDIITRDRFSRAHLVAAGRVRGDVEAAVRSQMLISAVDALSQSYDYLVLDVGAQMDIAPGLLVPLAPRVILVAGGASGNATGSLCEQLTSAGFESVVVFNGPPPGLDHAAVQTVAA